VRIVNADSMLSQFFERWLMHIKPNVSPRTHERYGDLLEITEAYAKLRESGRRDGKGGLARP
jgi:hypothetical protein